MADDTRLNDGEGLEIAQPADFGIERDEDGDLKPIMQKLPGSDGLAIRVIPVVDVEPVADVLEGTNPDDDRVDEVADEYIVEGPGADGDLSDFPDYVVNAVLQAVKDASGHQYFRAAEERRLREEAEMIDAIGAENLAQIAQIDQAQTEQNTNGQQP